MDQLICASLSHTHCWYEVGLLKVPMPQIEASNYIISILLLTAWSSKKNLNASRSSEHPPVKGENVKTFRWDHRLQIQNLFMASPIVVTLIGSTV